MTFLDAAADRFANRLTFRDLIVKRFVYGKPWLRGKIEGSGWKARSRFDEGGDCASCPPGNAGFQAPPPVEQNVETRVYNVPGTFDTIVTPMRYNSLPPVYYADRRVFIDETTNPRNY